MSTKLRTLSTEIWRVANIQVAVSSQALNIFAHLHCAMYILHIHTLCIILSQVIYCVSVLGF